MLMKIIWIVVIVKIAGLKTMGSLQYRIGAAEFLLIIEFLMILGCIYDVDEDYMDYGYCKDCRFENCG
jgi:ABC-type transport system involved in cytochrome c biogenesis permease subunit